MGKPGNLPNNAGKADDVGARGLDGLDPGNSVPDIAQKPDDTPPENPIDEDILAHIPQIPVENFAPLPEDGEFGPGGSILDKLFGDLV